MKCDEKLMRLLLRTGALLRRSRPDAGGMPKGGVAILEHLSREEGKSGQEIASLAGIRAQSASEALAKLEEKGYVKRLVSETDRRATEVYLTEEGERALTDALEERRIRAEVFFSCLENDEKEALARILTLLKESNSDNEPKNGKECDSVCTGLPEDLNLKR